VVPLGLVLAMDGKIFLPIKLREMFDIKLLHPCIKWIGGKNLQTKTIIPRILERVILKKITLNLL